MTRSSRLAVPLAVLALLALNVPGCVNANVRFAPRSPPPVNPSPAASVTAV